MERLLAPMTMPHLLFLGFFAFAFGLALASLVGGMAGRDGLPPGLTRKVFHAGIFTGAVPAQLLQGFWGVVTYGIVISLIVLAGYWQGPGSPFHDALARPPDEGPSRPTLLVPLASTAMGGLLATLLVGNFAVVGYLVCGWGDGAGEPVGKRWGRHWYSPPFAGKGQSSRSLEGSLGVLLVGSVGGAVALGLLGYSPTQALGIGLLCGTGGALAEGVSGSERDNFWVQLLPSLLAWWFLR